MKAVSTVIITCLLARIHVAEETRIVRTEAGIACVRVLREAFVGQSIEVARDGGYFVAPLSRTEPTLVLGTLGAVFLQCS